MQCVDSKTFQFNSAYFFPPVTLKLVFFLVIKIKINTFFPSPFIYSGTEKHDLVGLKKCPVCLRSPQMCSLGTTDTRNFELVDRDAPLRLFVPNPSELSENLYIYITVRLSKECLKKSRSYFLSTKHHKVFILAVTSSDGIVLIVYFFLHID